MKSTKNLRQYGNAERKIGGKREKGSKLDRKSSRGMIYENEELRLRTININAEVERGQSDIKRLRRENEQLRREIWTLRDECDRLNKRFKAKLIEHEHGSCSARHSGGSGGCGRASGHGGCDSNCNSDDSDSCDTCKCNDDQCSDECCVGGSCPQLSTAKLINAEESLDSAKQVERSNNALSNHAPALLSDDEEAPPLHAGFDHLSVVSEETLSNSELLPPATQAEQLLSYPPEGSGSQMTIPSLVGPLTPLTPIELVANQLNDLQAVVPPLSYFENVVHQHMGSNIGATPAANSPTSKVVKHTNGWDYNLQSPFAHRKYAAPPPAHTTLAPPPPSVKRIAASPTLTTFVPTIVTQPNGSHLQPDITVTAPSSGNVETVAITTMPANVLPPASMSQQQLLSNSGGSPKHFFAPLKPRLKINTALANKTLVAASVPVLPPAVPPKSNGDECRNCEPPDIYVANALASPYQRQALPNAASAVPPPVPLRGSSSQTDSVNLETILNDIEAISEDILAIQLDKKSGKMGGVVNGVNKTLAETDKTKKPYRSEMNLTLQYDDAANPTITSSKAVMATQTSLNAENDGNNSNTNNNNTRCTRSLEREHTESPSPRIPDPMAPFPDKHTYIGFDQLNHAAAKQKPPLPRTIGGVSSTPATPLKPPPPTPPARSYPSPLNLRCAGLARSNATATVGPMDRPSTPIVSGLAPNKSQLYSTVAHAAAKRAQFRTASTHMTRSLEVDAAAATAAAGNEPAGAVSPDAAEAAGLDAARRKARRVSIACGGDGSTPNTPDPLGASSPAVQLRSQAQQTGSSTSTPTNANSNNTTTTNTQQTVATTTNAINPTTGSCLDLPLALVNPALRSLKQTTSHSTPNSPHSVRRRSNSNSADCAPQTQSANASPRHTNVSAAASPHHLLQHNNGSCSNLPVAHQRKSSQDSTRGNSTELPAGEAGRSRCSRRHSDASNAPQRISGNSGGGGAGGAHHHHHHHHHQHQHSSSLLSNHLHHSHHSHQDSSTSSDRGSNSLASSRESSTSFSMRSHRRKISISSHTGGKIPWCGCWGNGCL